MKWSSKQKFKVNLFLHVSSLYLFRCLWQIRSTDETKHCMLPEMKKQRTRCNLGWILYDPNTNFLRQCELFVPEQDVTHRQSVHELLTPHHIFLNKHLILSKKEFSISIFPFRKFGIPCGLWSKCEPREIYTIRLYDIT
jgi:hypothetical protein